MTSRARKSVLVVIVIVFMTLAATANTSSAAPTAGAGSSASSGDFIFSLNLKSEFGHHGYLVRGGDIGPLYAFNIYGCWYGRNALSIISQDGFEGRVRLDVPDLPQGVTELLPSSVHIAPGNGETITADLRASAQAPLGDYEVTLRGRGGGVSHTAALSFSVVDQLPPCGS